ncbi:hypothetical protein M0804_010387 [Polistes exclamans]|nr:hypothetical protein M0804_010387 [Polistes exclamans]
MGKAVLAPPRRHLNSPEGNRFPVSPHSSRGHVCRVQDMQIASIYTGPGNPLLSRGSLTTASQIWLVFG